MNMEQEQLPEPERVCVIACEALYRELCLVAAHSRRVADLRFLTQGLHDLGADGMRERLQAEIDAAAPDRYCAVALGFGLCNNGTAGLEARDIPLVLPRAHDCITLFLGSTERYREYFDSHPGSFFHTTGWRERDRVNLEATRGIMNKLGLDMSPEELEARYGPENARYMLERIGGWADNYKRLAYIRMGLGPDAVYPDLSRREATARGWEFDELEGDPGLLERLVDGPWGDDEFLVVPPGRGIEPSHDDAVVRLGRGEAPHA